MFRTTATNVAMTTGDFPKMIRNHWGNDDSASVA